MNAQISFDRVVAPKLSSPNAKFNGKATKVQVNKIANRAVNNNVFFLKPSKIVRDSLDFSYIKILNGLTPPLIGNYFYVKGLYDLYEDNVIAFIK